MAAYGQQLLNLGYALAPPFGGAAERSEAERVSLVTSEPQALRWDRSIKEMCPSLSVVTRAAASPSQSKPYGFASSPKGRANCGSRAAGAEFRRCVASPFERLPPAGGRCRASDKGRTRWHCVSNDGEGEAAARMQTPAVQWKDCTAEHLTFGPKAGILSNRKGAGHTNG